MRRRPASTWFLVFLLAAVTVVASQAHSQSADDPRNKQRGEIHGAQDCYLCHSSEMVDAFHVLPRLPTQVALQSPTEAEVEIVNPWKHEVRNLTLFLAFPGQERRITPLASSESGSLVLAAERFDFRGEGRYRKIEAGDGRTLIGAITIGAAPGEFSVRPGAARIEATVEVELDDPNAPVEAARQGVQFWLQGPPHEHHGEGQRFPLHPENQTRATFRWTTVSLDDAHGNLTGPWALDWDLARTSTMETYVRFVARVQVVYGASANLDKHALPVDPNVTIPPGASVRLPLGLVGQAKGDQLIDLQVRAEAYYDHEDNYPDVDYYSRYATRLVRVGDSAVAAPETAARRIAIGGDPRITMGEITGFASAFLLPPAILLGGGYGRPYRRFVNQVCGGARRRVMFHNMLSLGLTLAALAHIVLFLLELRYGILIGTLWGGLAALGLLVLGLSGYYQVPLIQRHGYWWWQRVHMTASYLVLGFTLLHTVWDGAHFDEVRSLIPDWLLRVNVGN